MIDLQTVWGFQPAMYLFLGGMGAGAFVTAAILYFHDRAKNAKTICCSVWAATVCLIVGLLLLVSELTFPLRGMMLWQSFSHFTSWMTFGAWAVFAAMVDFGIVALLSTPAVYGFLSKKWKGLKKSRESIRRVLFIIGMVLGLIVAAYTGILLMSAPGVPLWNTIVLPCLFTVSALDTGVALVEVVSVVSKGGMADKSSKLLQRCVIVLATVELIVLFVFLGIMPGVDASTVVGARALASAATLVGGQLALFFWLLVVACGLIAPLAASVYRTVSKPKDDTSHTVAMVGAIGALVGGCALRFLVLAAGQHADIIMNAVSTLIY